VSPYCYLCAGACKCKTTAEYAAWTEIEACFNACQGMVLHSTVESDRYWEMAERLMNIFAEASGCPVSRATDDPTPLPGAGPGEGTEPVSCRFVNSNGRSLDPWCEPHERSAICCLTAAQAVLDACSAIEDIERWLWSPDARYVALARAELARRRTP